MIIATAALKKIYESWELPKTGASYHSRFSGTKRFRAMLDRSMIVEAGIQGA
jgi:hypothetical protein